MATDHRHGYHDQHSTRGDTLALAFAVIVSIAASVLLLVGTLQGWDVGIAGVQNTYLNVTAAVAIPVVAMGLVGRELAAL